MTINTATGVTVCICTFNRADLLDQTLGQFSKLRVDPAVAWELIVINNHSTDHTDAVLQRHAASGLRLRTIFEPTQGLSHARNRGLADARFPWILFTDDDVQIGEDWLNAFAAGIGRHPDAAVAGGPIEPWFPQPADPLLVTVFPELRRGFCGIDHGPAEGVLAANQDVFGANFALHRDRLGSLRFDPALGVPRWLHEETALIGQVRRNGGQVLWIPAMRVRHYVDPARMTLAYLRRYRAMQGASCVTIDGVASSPSLFGMPRWLLRKWLTAHADALANRIVGRRRAALVALREASFLDGMVGQIRANRLKPEVT